MLEGNLGLHDASNVLDHLPLPMEQMLSPTGLQRFDATSEIDRTAHVNDTFILDEQSYRNHRLSRQEQQYVREGVATVRMFKNVSLTYFRK